MSGRITDLAVYESNPAIFYVGTAHGGMWKSINNGTTFEPQFQEQGFSLFQTATDIGLMSAGAQQLVRGVEGLKAVDI